MSRVPYVRARLRAATVIAATGAIVAAGLLTPVTASATTAPPATRSNVLGGTSLSADGWTGPATDPASGFDFSTKNEVLHGSNVNANGVITQLESPVTQEAGEPGYTDAAFDTYHFAFTLDGHALGSNKYAAQPGTALEVDADQGGNRAGGGVYFNVPANNVLEIDNFSSAEASGQLWNGATKRIAFKAPVAIDYTVRFVAGGGDIVTVKADGKTVLSTGAGTYEGYSFGKAAAADSSGVGTTPDADTVDQVLFRTTHNGFNTEWTPGNTDVDVAPWAPLSAPVPTTPGGGFSFSKLTYGAEHSGAAAFANASSVTTPYTAIQDYEDPAGANYTSWHIGSNGQSTDTSEYFDVLSNGNVQLNDFAPTDSHSVQLIKGIASNNPNDLYSLVRQGLAYTLTTDKLGSLQIPVIGANIAHDPTKSSTGFATLHSEVQSEHTGLNVVSLSDRWVATHAIGSIAANTDEPLGVLLAALEPGVAADPDSASSEPTAAITDADVTVLGFGISSEATAGQTTTTFGPIYFGGVKYLFSGDPRIALGSTSIAGDEVVGGTVTAAAPTVTPIDSALSYQWLRNGSAISGSAAKHATYVPTSSDFGKKLSVKVTASSAGRVTVSTTSPATDKIATGTITRTGGVVINGTAQVGVKLTLTKPTYAPTSMALSYQWFRNGTKISGATGSTYTVVPADLNAPLTATITAKKTDFTSLPATSDPTDAVAEGTIAVSGTPTITGTVKTGKTLTATSKGWTADGVATTSETATYFWFLSDGTTTPMAGDLVQSGKSSTLKLTSVARGLKVSVYVVGSKTGYASATSPLSAFSATAQ